MNYKKIRILNFRPIYVLFISVFLFPQINF